MKAPNTKQTAISQTRTLSESEVDSVTGGAKGTSTTTPSKSTFASANPWAMLGATEAGRIVGPRPPAGH
jgi:hypothetical protein